MQKKIIGAAISVLGCLLAVSITCFAQSQQFQSRGKIVYRENSGEKVVFDADDFERLFQYAAESKKEIGNALGGVGVNNVPTDISDYDVYKDLLLSSQDVPGDLHGQVTLATDDNVTLGRAGFAAGNLIMGNNHDLIMSYLLGWVEGSGRSDLEVFEENGQMGIRRKE